MHQHSIVSGKVADDLLARLPKDGSPVTLGPFPDGTGRQEVIWITARRLTKGKTQQNRLRLSGGVTISSWTRGAPNVGAHERRIVRRLRPGWSAESFHRAASLCYMEARQRAHLELLRENLYAKFHPYERDEALIAAAARSSRADGRTMIYGEMTREDCEFWTDWLAEYVDKMEGEVVRLEQIAEDMSYDRRAGGHP